MRSFDVRVQFGDGYKPTDEGVLIAQGDQAGGYLLYIEDGDLHFCHNYGGRTRDFNMDALGQNLERIDLAFVAQPEGVCSVQIEVHGEQREVPAQFNLFTGATPFQGIDVGIDRRSPVSRALRSRRGTFAYAGALCSVTITPGQRLSEIIQSSTGNVDEQHKRLAERLDD
jgi:arylsulfatase